MIIYFLYLYSNFYWHVLKYNPITNQVGGAGATCYQTVNDIADVHPGVGFVHTQSYMNSENQKLAKNLMDKHYSPKQIMDSLKKGDVEQNPSIRQYAAIDLTVGSCGAAFTGENCFDYKGSRIGRNYVIVGNILAGPHITSSSGRNPFTQTVKTDAWILEFESEKLPECAK